MRKDRVTQPVLINPDECLVGPKDVARITGMSPRWAQETFRHLVEPIKISGRLRWPLWQVKAWVETQKALGR